MAILLKAISASDIILSVSADTNLPASNGVILIGTERIIYDDNYMGTLYGCTRGAQGTSAASHLVGSLISLVDFYSGTETITNLTINSSVPSQGLTVNGKILGVRNNGSSLSVKGLQDPSEGVAQVNSYSGIFYNSGYNITGSLKTRFITGGNLEMDVEVQSPHQLRLIAGDNTTLDANVYIMSNTTCTLHARAEQEAVDAYYLVVDRIDTGTRGLFNTSEIVLKANSKNLHLNTGITNGGVSFPQLTTTQKDAISSLYEGLVVYDTTLHKLCVYTARAGGSSTGWETITSVLE